MRVKCPECQHRQDVPDDAGVLRVRCTQCRTVFNLPHHATGEETTL